MIETQHVPAWVPADVTVLDVRETHHNQHGTFTAIKVKFPEFDGTQHCAGMDVEIFYGDGVIPGLFRYRAHEEVPVCKGCPFRTQCREWGIAHEEYGVWGGLSNQQREQVRAERRQGFWSRQAEVSDGVESWAIALGVFRAQAEADRGEDGSEAA